MFVEQVRCELVLSLWSFTPPLVKSKPKTGVPASHKQIWRGFCWLICLQSYRCCSWSVLSRNCTFIRWALKGTNPQKKVVYKPSTQGSPCGTWGGWTLPKPRGQIAELCHLSLCVWREVSEALTWTLGPGVGVPCAVWGVQGAARHVLCSLEEIRSPSLASGKGVRKGQMAQMHPRT